MHFCSQAGTSDPRHNYFVQCFSCNTTKNFQAPTRLSSLWKGGGEGSARHLLFTFQAAVEPSHGASREACVHWVEPGCDASAGILARRSAQSPACAAIPGRTQPLVPGTRALLNWLQGGLCLLHKWLRIVNSPFSSLLPAIGTHSIRSVKYHMAFDSLSLWD